MDNQSQPLADGQGSRQEEGQGEGRAGAPAEAGQFPTTVENNPAPGENHPDVKKRRGRPPGSRNRPQVLTVGGAPAPAPVKATPGAPAVEKPTRAEAIRRRQRKDCRELARRVAELQEAADLGAGRDGNRAAALGTLVRATATLHELEQQAYGLAGDRAGGRDKVLVLPVPVTSMEEWAKTALALAGGQQAAPIREQAHGPRRVSEDDPEGEGGA
jgi:hypothetical protein